jgi:hypothetical protein
MRVPGRGLMGNRTVPRPFGAPLAIRAPARYWTALVWSLKLASGFNKTVTLVRVGCVRFPRDFTTTDRKYRPFHLQLLPTVSILNPLFPDEKARLSFY